MTRNLSAEAVHDGLFDVDSKAVSVTLPVGSAIFAYQGTVWLTQEGLRDDVILQPGERYTVRSRRLIVVSAVRGSAKIWVAAPERAAISGSDLFALLRASADHARAEAIRRAVGSARDGLSHALAAAIATARRTIEPLRRIPGH